MSQQTQHHPCFLRKRRFLSKRTVFTWVCLFALCVLFIVFELGRYYQPLGLNRLPLWGQVIVPLSDLVDDNFINLFISQISTTFLVTAFLSFLGDKNAQIYWTTAMDHKLVHPKGSSLMDLASYSFCTLPISLLAILLQAKLCFFCSFLINIWVLVVITWRMIMTFYSRKQIKDELQELFRQESPQKQQENLRAMEENMVRAAHDHDIEYLRECKEFLEEFISSEDAEAFKAEAKEVNLCLQSLDFIAEMCSAYINDENTHPETRNAFGQCAYANAKRVAARLQHHLTVLYAKHQPCGSELPKDLEDSSKWELPDFIHSDQPDQVAKQLAALAKKTKAIADLAENPLWLKLSFYRTQQISDNRYLTSMLRYISIIPDQFAELQLSAMQAICRGIGFADLMPTDADQRQDLRNQHFAESLKIRRNVYFYTFPIILTLRQRTTHLLRKNFREAELRKDLCSWSLDMLLAVHLIMLEHTFHQEIKGTSVNSPTKVSFHLLFVDLTTLLQEAYENHWAVGPYVQAILTLCALIKSGLKQIYFPETDPKELPDALLNRISLFSAEQAVLLVNAACSESTQFEDVTAIYDLVETVCQDARHHSVEVKEQLSKIITQSPQLGDDRDYLLSFLNPSN